ncbi:MAG: hypothetical protein FWE16_01455 [Firmicutes bacterium]|nr:hypothetical protein [Bacillota bacterium]
MELSDEKKISSPKHIYDAVKKDEWHTGLTFKLVDEIDDIDKKSVALGNLLAQLGLFESWAKKLPVDTIISDIAQIPNKQKEIIQRFDIRLPASAFELDFSVTVYADLVAQEMDALASMMNANNVKREAFALSQRDKTFPGRNILDGRYMALLENYHTLEKADANLFRASAEIWMSDWWVDFRDFLQGGVDTKKLGFLGIESSDSLRVMDYSETEITEKDELFNTLYVDAVKKAQKNLPLVTSAKKAVMAGIINREAQFHQQGKSNLLAEDKLHQLMFSRVRQVYFYSPQKNTRSTITEYTDLDRDGFI